MKTFRFSVLSMLTVSFLSACEPTQPEVAPQNAHARLAASSTTLQAGQSMQKGSLIKSANGGYYLTFQLDGNLVLYRNNMQREPLWASNTYQKGSTCILQADGNFVVYDISNKVVWMSGISGFPGTHISLQDDGNLVQFIDAREALILWSTNTNQTFYNPKLANITQAFQNVNDHASQEDLKGVEPLIPNMAESHVQGVAYYKDYAIFSHNNMGNSRGKLIIVNRTNDKLVHNIDIPIENLNHPGGIQVIGNFLAVSVEPSPNSNDKKSYILFYDLTTLNNSTPPTLLDKPRIDRTTGAQQGKAGAVGITNYTTPDGKEHYKVVVFDNMNVDTYTSNEYPLGDDRLQFTYEKSFRLKGSGLQGVCLLTSTDQNINMVGFAYDSPQDRLMLFDKDGNQLFNRHFYNNYGSTGGSYGVHFRWGSGLQIQTYANKSPDFLVMCTQRNFVGGLMTLNNFKPKE